VRAKDKFKRLFALQNDIPLPSASKDCCYQKENLDQRPKQQCYSHYWAKISSTWTLDRDVCERRCLGINVRFLEHWECLYFHSGRWTLTQWQNSSFCLSPSDRASECKWVPISVPLDPSVFATTPNPTQGMVLFPIYFNTFNTTRATGYRLDVRGIGSSSPGVVKNFHFPVSTRPTLGPTQRPIRGELFAWGVKLPERKADHSPPTNARSWNNWSIYQLSNTSSCVALS
jgi:hypothetical protein